MVFTVRCFKCGSDAVRLVLGGRRILHAKCEQCGSNLLDEVMEFEAALKQPRQKRICKPTIEISVTNAQPEDTWASEDDEAEEVP